MSTEGVSFEEGGAWRRRNAGQEKPDLAERIIRTGIVRERKGANAVLIGIALMIAIIAVLVLIMSGKRKEPYVPPGAELITNPSAPPRLSVPIGHRP